ncbi:MAG TPA: winged helix-turn-helix transcriptional regulator [Actinomycetota bacterium]|jgi:DNA-binding HxlR family transcriptional regulator/putative sterol carrier protein
MSRSYEQYCPLARALDVIGDRWAMLVMRELFLSPKRYTDLQQRLSGIAPNLLSRRLKELEAVGLVRRRRLDPPAASTVYETTEKAAGLETAMVELAKWGVQFLGDYDGEAFALDWLLPIMEEFADRDAARNVWEVYEFQIDGLSFWVDVNDGEVTIRPGSAPRNADLLVETDLETFMAIGFGAISPDEAKEAGRTRVVGDESKGERALDILAPARIVAKLSSAGAATR